LIRPTQEEPHFVGCLPRVGMYLPRGSIGFSWKPHHLFYRKHNYKHFISLCVGFHASCKIYMIGCCTLYQIFFFVICIEWYIKQCTETRNKNYFVLFGLTGSFYYLQE